MESVERSFDTLTQQQSELNLSIIQLTTQVKDLAKQQQRTADNLDRHLAITEAQTANIAELIRLCIALAGRQR